MSTCTTCGKTILSPIKTFESLYMLMVNAENTANECSTEYQDQLGRHSFELGALQSAIKNYANTLLRYCSCMDNGEKWEIPTSFEKEYSPKPLIPHEDLNYDVFLDWAHRIKRYGK